MARIKFKGGSSGGGNAVHFSNSDGSLTISPNTGTITASLNLGNSNTWTGIQTFRTAGIRINYTSVSANTTLGNSHCFAAVDTSGGSITITIPTGVNSGRFFIIKKTSASNTLTIARSGSDVFDNSATSISITTLDSTAFIFYDGVSIWHQLKTLT